MFGTVKRLIQVALGSFIVLFTGGIGHAQTSVEQFYKGQTVTFIIGYSAGGGYDTYARLVARHLGKHIPGRPTIVPRNMPGASSRVAAAYVYNAAPKDGTILTTGDQSLALAQAMGQKLQFDAMKFNYIGTPVSENNTTATWHASGIKTIDDAKKQEVPIGATGGSTSSQYPRAMNAVLGTKFKVILGYPGGNEINLAMERGEVAGRGSTNWASWKATKPEWLKEKKINILVQIGLAKAQDLPDVPLLMDLATNPEDRALLKLVSAPSAIGRPIFTTPEAPPERVKALRDAFNATMKDPEFLDDAKKAGLELDPSSGEALQKIVAEIIATPKPIAERLAGILAEGAKQKK